MKNQALFSSKDKSTILKCRMLQFLFGTLRVNKFLGGNICQYAMEKICAVFHGIVYHGIHGQATDENFIKKKLNTNIHLVKQDIQVLQYLA